MITWWFLTLIAFYLFVVVTYVLFFSFQFLTKPAVIQNILVKRVRLGFL